MYVLPTNSYYKVPLHFHHTNIKGLCNSQTLNDHEVWHEQACRMTSNHLSWWFNCSQQITTGFEVITTNGVALHFQLDRALQKQLKTFSATFTWQNLSWSSTLSVKFLPLKCVKRCIKYLQASSWLIRVVWSQYTFIWEYLNVVSSHQQLIG